MDRKKIIVCTILFAIVLSVAFIGTYFIENKDGVILGYIVSAIITGFWMLEYTIKFHNWLMK